MKARVCSAASAPRVCGFICSLLSASALAADEDAKVLPKIRVQDDAVSAASEGTGAYTTESTSTATGLELSWRDTPQSVSVITRARIDDYALNEVADALIHTTGVSLKAVDRGRNQITVRGFDITNFQFDGMPFLTGNVGLEELSTVLYDRIEIVRGATGLTTGAGQPSAAVNLVRKHADSDILTIATDVEAGSWDRLAGTVDFTTPLNASASVRARVVAHAYQQDAFIDLEESDGTVFYAVLDADLTPSTRLSVGASSQRDQRSGVLWFPLPLWYSDGTRTDFDRSTTTAARWNQWDTTEEAAFATLTHELQSGWNLRADVSFHEQEEDSKLLWLEGDPDRVTGLGMTAYPYHYLATPKQLHFGATATGPFEWLGRTHELTVGLMHNRLKDGWSNRDPIDDMPEVGDIRQWDGSYPEPALGERFLGSAGTTTQIALYSAARVQLTDKFKLIAGGRVSRWERDEEAGAWTANAFTVKHDDVFTPYAGVLYDLTDQITAYASYTDIFTPQTSYRDRNGRFLDPLEGKSYEAGLKSELVEGTLNASLAIFRIDQDNFAVADEGFQVPGTIEQAYRGAQGTISEGYEVEVAGALTADWNVSLGWTHYSAKDADGAHVASHHPRQMFKLDTTYALRALLPGLSVGASVRWEDQPPKRQINPIGVEEATGQPAYTLVDVVARYQFNPRWSAQVNVDNLFDEKYRSASEWWSGFLYGEPRSARASVRFSF